jgi:uncharacterized membrane protein (DUF2068 family)
VERISKFDLNGNPVFEVQRGYHCNPKTSRESRALFASVDWKLSGIQTDSDAPERICVVFRFLFEAVGSHRRAGMWNAQSGSRETAMQVPITFRPHGTPPSMSEDRGIRLIALLKFIKGMLLLVSGIGLLKILHGDTASIVIHFINTLHVDPDNRFIQNLILKASVVSDRQLKGLSVGSFFFSGLALTEGMALMLQKHWAKYFTLIVTMSFIPLELWGLIDRFSWIKIALIAVNLAIVWYLAIRVRWSGVAAGCLAANRG